MEENIVEEIKKECNLKERILLKVFARTFVKVYNIARVKAINNILV